MRACRGCGAGGRADEHRKTLDIYYIDTEGGQSTLFVSPTGESLLVDTGNAGVARLLLPILSPKAYLPVHWDGLYGAFEAGVPRPYADGGLDPVLAQAKVQLLRPVQYMDKWRLDHDGVRPMANETVKKALGF